MADHRHVLAAYLEDIQLQGLTPKTMANYESNLRSFLDHLGDLPLADIGVPQLSSWLGVLRKQGKAAKTITREFTAINSFIQYLEFSGQIQGNPVPAFRKRYLGSMQREARKHQVAQRQLLEVDQMSALLQSALDVRDRTAMALMAKCGLRRHEALGLDVASIDFAQQALHVTPTPKRTNNLVFFDDETHRLLRRYLRVREQRTGTTDGPLLISQVGTRMGRNAAYNLVTEHAASLGFHNPGGALKDKFTPHCFRHWFTTHLRRSGMRREYVSWLRGDAPQGTIDLYLHIDPQDVREEYQQYMPRLGI